MSKSIISVLSVSLLLLLKTTSSATAASSDPKALAIVAKSIAALTSGNTVTDVTLLANAIRIAGSDYENGTATMAAKTLGQSRIDYTFGSVIRTEIRDGSGPIPAGSWAENKGSDSTGTTTPYTLQNCLTEPVWFFPALSLLSASSNPSLTLSYVGPESWNGLSVEHIRASWIPNAAAIPKLSSARPDFSRLSAIDVYLDAVSLLPDAIAFNTHPDDGADLDIPVEIRYANYQSMNGIQIPMHIQKLLNGSLLLDLTVSSAAINGGISPAQFKVR